MSDADLISATYREKVMGCWLGKAVGGTLGMPFEGLDGPFDLTFYNPVPTEMMPNDDLDLQVLWLDVLRKMPVPNVSRFEFAKAWLHQVAFPFDEYAVAIRNLANGIAPPLSGSYDNYFIRGMGAAIRSELWACLAPGNPDLAAKYAYEDACVDHDGDGIWAEVFLAALESAAFVSNELHTILDLATIQLPIDSVIRCAITDTRLWWQQTGDWRKIRQLILAKYEDDNFTDAVANLAFTILGLLAGKGDFGRSICIAANCGKDTDCTAASAGALLGIMNPKSIDEKWLKPIGRQLVVSPEITGIAPAKNLDEFTDQVIDMHRKLSGKAPEVKPIRQDLSQLAIEADLAFDDGLLYGGGYHALNFTMPPMTGKIERVKFSGTLARLPYGAFRKPVALVRYRIKMDTARSVRVMVNTPANCRVWLDGTYLFGREGGRMAPSFHRAPLNQSANADLSAGVHELVIALAAPAHPQQDTLWVVGLGDPKTKQWLPNFFCGTP